MNNHFNFVNTYSFKLIYVFKVDDELHNGILKIGEATLNTDKKCEELYDNCDELNESAKKRIRQYTNTLGVQEELLYTTLAINNNKKTFKDKDVHRILKNTGINRHDFGNEKDPEEWYETNLETVKNAINAAKEGRKSLNRTEVDEEHEDIVFRPEQKAAIDFTLKRFCTTNNVLWNAKMRFGKTLSALEVVKRMSDDEKFKLSRVIILTHRPVVDEGWFKDYGKIFWDRDDFLYGSKSKSSIHDLISSKKKFIYFASMQDLRESGAVGGRYNKNDAVFNTDWDLLIVDEAHEGTQTELGQNVIKAILNSEVKTPKSLMLSGTPFNLLSDFESNDIYTWDYIMEQKAKLEWEELHPLEPNPYADLPKMNILTYNLEDYLPQYHEVADSAFNFKEFFRVWTGDAEKDGKELLDRNLIGRFIHESDVVKFLELLTKQDENSNYPFSRREYIENCRHSFWILPGVKEAKALKELMLENRIFSQFNIVNVAGTGDDNGYEALDAVEKAIGDDPDDSYTITLSCGKLTTGVTVEPWTAVLYLAGSYSTSASSYLQTIFRVQSPSSYGGKQKTNCYVFDFAPDRTLKMIAEAGDLSVRVGAVDDRERMKLFLNYCPVISVNGSEMKSYNVNTMLQQLKKAYVERVVNNGFDDSKIYNDNLLKLNDIEVEMFNNLKGIIGTTKQNKKVYEIDINRQGFSDEEWAEIEKDSKKPKASLTEEQKALLEEIKEKKKQKNNAISILRGISIRIPLLIYGASVDYDDDITIDNFTDIIDDVSWEEFMPRGITKEKFKELSKYYDSEIFIEAGRRIRNIAKHADSLSPIERAKTISNLFLSFRNPDKETVLTPWQTVNRHLSDTIGGYSFYDNYIVSLEDPRFINRGDVTRNILMNKDANVLEINSKTGLYPLYVTISLYKNKCINMDSKKLDDDVMKEIWKQTVEDNIYVICRTPMAKSITKRTLVGYNDFRTNVIDIETIVDDLVEKKHKKIIDLIKDPRTWNKEGDKMKFDAIIGNPPYQQQDNGSNDADSVARTSAVSVYQHFVEISKALSDRYVSLIIPSRWMTGGKGLDSFRIENMKDTRYTVIHDYENDQEVFPNTDIGGGVMYYLWDAKHDGKLDYYLHGNNSIEMSNRYLYTGDNIIIRDYESAQIMKKINSDNSFMNIVSARNPFSFVKEVQPQEQFNDVKSEDYGIKYYCWDGTPTVKYTKEKYIVEKDLLKSYKVFISKTADPPIRFGRENKAILRKPFYGDINEACSETYLTIGCFNNDYEVKAIIKYISTRFFRFLVLQKKKTQNVSRGVFEFVPMQDFTRNSDIDWEAKIDDIDNQLNKKYDLTQTEIDYIYNKVDLFD